MKGLILIRLVFITRARRDLCVLYDIDHPHTIIYSVYYSIGVVNIVEREREREREREGVYM